MNIIDCRKVRDNLISQAKGLILKWKLEPKLAVVQVEGDKASDRYVRNKKIMCEKVGIEFEHVKLPNNCTEDRLFNVISRLNDNESVTGIILQLPLPEHLKYCEQGFINLIDKEKDVDGLTDGNTGRLWNDGSCLSPCTASGIVSILSYYEMLDNNPDVCVVGRSRLIGKPLAKMLLDNDCTVTVCHSRTNDLKKHTSEADIVVLATGNPKMFDKSYFKDNAIVIDAGISIDENGKVCGDADSETFKDTNISYTSVPGGVGIMTVAELMYNVVMSDLITK